jgi:hypothetical protein
MFVLMIAVALGIPILIAAATLSWKTLVPIDTRRRTGKKLGEIAGHVAMTAMQSASAATKLTFDCVSSAVLDPLTSAANGIRDYTKNVFAPNTGPMLAGSGAGGINGTYRTMTTGRLRDDGGGTRNVMKMLMSTFSGAKSSTNQSDGRDDKPTTSNCHGTSRGDPATGAGSRK